MPEAPALQRRLVSLPLSSPIFVATTNWLIFPHASRGARAVVDVFSLRQPLDEDYADLKQSFVNMRGPRISGHVERVLEADRNAESFAELVSPIEQRAPVIDFNPAYSRKASAQDGSL